ncbi:MAG TPA: hypothetical protein VFM05_01905 [Candidatus Saccharimonadales bacterium]|nr:hypothetical protein [Candidatus Saccharimonadales bacterium]
MIHHPPEGLRPQTYDPDSLVVDDVDVLPRLGSDPEDQMVIGADGQLHSVHAQRGSGRPAGEERFDQTAGGAAVSTSPEAGRSATTDGRARVGETALHGVYVRPSGIGPRRTRTYRSSAAAGALHAQPHAIASHRGD